MPTAQTVQPLRVNPQQLSQPSFPPGRSAVPASALVLVVRVVQPPTHLGEQTESKVVTGGDQSCVASPKDHSVGRTSARWGERKLTKGQTGKPRGQVSGVCSLQVHLSQRPTQLAV